MNSLNHPIDNYLKTLTRRQLFQRVGMGVGGFALAELFGQDLGARSAPPISHFAPKAKSVIYFHLVGAPSHLDLFDYKPQLQKRSGELCPNEMFEGKKLAFILAVNQVFKFLIYFPIYSPVRMRCALFELYIPISLIMPRPRCLCRRDSSDLADQVWELGQIMV